MGTKEKDEMTGKILNDILMPPSELGMGEVHLIIRYNKEEKTYYLKDNGQGTGTFFKIGNILELKDGFIFTFGESTMGVKIENNIKIQLKFIDGPKTDEILYLKNNKN